MKKIFLFLIVAICPFVAIFAQYYNVGTSTTGRTDVFGNTTTTHRNCYGNTTGTSTTGQTDMFGNSTTTHKDRCGNTIGTSTTGQTDMFGNTTTKQKSNNSNTEIWTW